MPNLWIPLPLDKHMVMLLLQALLMAAVSISKLKGHHQMVKAKGRLRAISRLNMEASSNLMSPTMSQRPKTKPKVHPLISMKLFTEVKTPIQVSLASKTKQGFSSSSETTHRSVPDLSTTTSCILSRFFLTKDLKPRISSWALTQKISTQKFTRIKHSSTCSSSL